MRTKIGRNRKLLTAEDAHELARPMVEQMVAFRARERGKMAAYDDVAADMGVTASWLRKFLGRQPQILIALHDYLNLPIAYGPICEMIEAAADREKERADELKRRNDAALGGPAALVARMAAAKSGGGAGARASVSKAPASAVKGRD